MVPRMPICTMRLRVEHAILDGAPERRAVGQLLAAEIGVAGIAVRIHVDQAERLLGAERAQNRIGNDVIAADGKGRDAGLGEMRGSYVSIRAQRVLHVRSG